MVSNVKQHEAVFSELIKLTKQTSRKHNASCPVPNNNATVSTLSVALIQFDIKTGGETNSEKKRG